MFRPADLAILVPMLGRPHHVVPLLTSIDATVPGARVLFLCTPGDRDVISEIDAAGRERVLVPRIPDGDYARKINLGYRQTTEPLLFTGASDLNFCPRWFEAARARLEPGIGVVGTNDLGSPRVKAGKHSTHSLVTREYADVHGLIDKPGAILHEGYHHFYVDDELVATARHRGAWAMASSSRVEHLHPYWNKAPRDKTYNLGCQKSQQDQAKFEARRHLWGDE
jgi:hypothetical protein